MSMPPEVKEIRDILRTMDVEDQLSVLLYGIIEANGDALTVSLRVLDATRRLSEHQSAESRFKISTRMRDYADILEQPLVVHEI